MKGQTLMGEANRVAQFGPMARVNRNNQQLQQIEIDMKNATPKKCLVCGSELFTSAIKLYTVSALLSPTGQELLAQQPVLICNNCGEIVK